jgi:hypothetical protein
LTAIDLNEPSRPNQSDLEASRALYREEILLCPEIAARDYDLITQAHAKEVIEGSRMWISDLGCWRADLKENHRCHYTLKNMTRTLSWLPGNPCIGYNPYLHYVATIAKGDVDLLKRIGGKLPDSREHLEISHLCHHGWCFNPDHLVVESNTLNQA